MISRLIVAAEYRGEDSTGVAFRTTSAAGRPSTCVGQHAVSATQYVRLNWELIDRAEKSTAGIIHVRNASVGMPIDNDNAHPFYYGGRAFAHNGKISNWKELRDAFADKLRGTIASSKKLETLDGVRELLKQAKDSKDHELWGQLKRLAFIMDAKTDSKVLGFCIESGDFSEVEGCAGLTWLSKDGVFVVRHAKELECVELIWFDDQGVPHEFTLCISEMKIFENSTVGMKFKPTVKRQALVQEGLVHQLLPSYLGVLNRVTFKKRLADFHSSASVQAEETDEIGQL